jgi:hypothetical protein
MLSSFYASELLKLLHRGRVTDPVLLNGSLIDYPVLWIYAYDTRYKLMANGL